MSSLIPREVREARLVEEAIVALHDGAGLDANLIGTVSNTSSPGYDAEIDVIVDGKPRRYVVQCKTVLDRRANVQQIKQQLETVHRPGLLIAPYISREIARYCRDIGLQFIDTHGNAYLNGPGLLVYMTGERRENGLQSVRPTGGTTGQAALRIAFVLLSKPDMVAAPYREIASAAGVSLGAVSKAFEDLERRGYVIAGRQSRGRQLLEPLRLLDEWALNYPMQLRPKLSARRYSVPDPAWWANEHLEGAGAVWGGEVAAKHLTHYLKPATQTIYVEPSQRSTWLKHIVMSYRAKPDPNGPLEILDKFWGDSLQHEKGFAPPALIYADLLASLDPRAVETAQILRVKWTK